MPRATASGLIMNDRSHAIVTIEWRLVIDKGNISSTYRLAAKVYLICVLLSPPHHLVFFGSTPPLESNDTSKPEVSSPVSTMLE